MHKISTIVKASIRLVVNSIPDIVTCSLCRSCCKSVTMQEVQRCRKIFWASAFFGLLALTTWENVVESLIK